MIICSSSSPRLTLVAAGGGADGAWGVARALLAAQRVVGAEVPEQRAALIADAPRHALCGVWARGQGDSLRSHTECLLISYRFLQTKSKDSFLVKSG